MIITKKHLSRRTFMRGTLGATIALPFLDAMVPALTAQARTAAGAPFRFGVVYMPCGVYPDTWHPTQVGSDFEFKPVMQPLEPFRYKDYCVMATIGRGAAVGDIFGLKVSGFLAWLFWVFLHVFWLIGFRNRFVVMTEWAWAYFTLQRRVRLITGDRDVQRHLTRR